MVWELLPISARGAVYAITRSGVIRSPGGAAASSWPVAASQVSQRP